MARKSKKQKKRATAMRYLVVLLLIALFALVVSMAMKAGLFEYTSAGHKAAGDRHKYQPARLRAKSVPCPARRFAYPGARA